MRKKILLLGSGELGKEFVIACQRLGQYVIAVDSYEAAPAMQVAHQWEVINMLDGDALDRIVAKHQPDIIVPEIEAIRTERFYDYESKGIQVVPSAKAANFTMNRKAIRDLAAIQLGVRTAPLPLCYFSRGIKGRGSLHRYTLRCQTPHVELGQRAISDQD
jgi:phosphoribosylglycinamide formyltransferase 2